MRNPLVFPPKDIVSRGCTAILEYLREEWQRLNPEEILTNKSLTEHESEQGICFLSRESVESHAK